MATRTRAATAAASVLAPRAIEAEDDPNPVRKLGETPAAFEARRSARSHAVANEVERRAAAVGCEWIARLARQVDRVSAPSRREPVAVGRVSDAGTWVLSVSVSGVLVQLKIRAQSDGRAQRYGVRKYKNRLTVTLGQTEDRALIEPRGGYTPSTLDALVTEAIAYVESRREQAAREQVVRTNAERERAAREEASRRVVRMEVGNRYSHNLSAYVDQVQANAVSRETVDTPIMVTCTLRIGHASPELTEQVMRLVQAHAADALAAGLRGLCRSTTDEICNLLGVA